MKGKSKVSPEEIIVSSDSSDGEDTGPFRFLHLKRRKLDKEILIFILEPEKSFIERRYNADTSYIVYMATSSWTYGQNEKDGQRPSHSARNNQGTIDIGLSSNDDKPVNFLLKGTTIQKSSNVLHRPYPPYMPSSSSSTGGQNENLTLGLPLAVKRVPGSTSLHATNKPRLRQKEKEIKSHRGRGCSVS